MRKISPKSSHWQGDGHQSKGLNRQKDKRQRNASKLRLKIELEVILTTPTSRGSFVQNIGS